MAIVKSSVYLDKSLLPEYQKWKSPEKELGIWSYVNMRADYDLAAAFSKLFWPDFVEIDQCVLLAEKYDPKRFKEWMQRYDNDFRAVESIVNHVHIYDLFMNSPNEEVYSLELFEYLAQVLMRCWKYALADIFPDKQFTFEYKTEPDAYGPTITFYQSWSTTR
ncbi:MAG TPA: hypothetical protein VKY74_13665 [Chloroflexia bacterium]|nr:hypothetical protein [Chloroflexia bacterium]